MNRDMTFCYQRSLCPLSDKCARCTRNYPSAFFAKLGTVTMTDFLRVRALKRAAKFSCRHFLPLTEKAGDRHA